MRLSLIIPAYNEAKNIAQCLQSIFDQKLPPKHEIEIIVVNNASTDETASVAASFSGVKVIDEPRKGISQARQTGFLASTGDLIANIDADNRLPAGWIEKVFDEFANNKQLLSLSGPYIYYDLADWQNFLVKLYYLGGKALYLVTHYFFHFGAMLQGGNYVIRREALEKIGGYDTTISFYGEDTDVARRVSQIGENKFTFSLPMFSSGRRLLTEGMLLIAFKYGLNYIWVIFLKKPFSRHYRDIRH